MKKTISVRSTKEAALYFEQVLPFDSITAWRGGSDGDGNYEQAFPYENVILGSKVIKSLLPETKDGTGVVTTLLGLQFIISKNISGSTVEAEDPDVNEILSIIKREHGIDIDLKSIQDKSDNSKNIIISETSKYVNNLGFQNSTLWGAESTRGTPIAAETHTFEAAISGLNLVDVSKTSWDQVIEFRKDKDSFTALRDLRLFYEENFLGKNLSYISDKLMQLTDKQEKAAKLWGFETAQKSLSVVFSNQSAIMSSATTLAAILGGATLPAVAGAALVFPIGSAMLEFSRIIIEAKKEPVERSTRFITRLKKLSKDNSS